MNSFYIIRDSWSDVNMNFMFGPASGAIARKEHSRPFTVLYQQRGEKAW
jgi:hypothetical protein